MKEDVNMTEYVPDSSLKSKNKVATALPIFEEFKVIELLTQSIFWIR